MKGFKEDKDYNIELYTKLLEKHQISHKSLNWGNKSSQELRFKVLSEIGFKNNATVLDLGCGIGDFYNWISNKKIDIRYQGIDITPRMIELAKVRFPMIDFGVQDILEESYQPEFDYIVSSGIFYSWKKSSLDFMKAIIAKMYDSCAKGIAFNSLSGWSDQKEKNEFWPDPMEIIIFCKKITPWVTLRHDYHSNDFTVYMYKERNI